MDEITRNMFGFMLVSVFIGAAGILWYSFHRRRRPPFWKSLGLLSALAVLGVVVFWFCGLLEMPCAYAFTIWRMSGAVSANGVPVSKIIKKDGGYWETDDYFAYICCPNQDFLTTLRLKTPSVSMDYYFEYDSRTRVVVPISDNSAGLYPELMPKGDKLVNAYELTTGTNGGVYLGDGGPLKLPVEWFRNVTNRESTSKSK